MFDDVPPGNEPPEAHDLRVEAFAKAMARQDRHQLHVDISWQMPPKIKIPYVGVACNQKLLVNESPTTSDVVLPL
ncbi:unnamed protein product [Haemonchus placei]|uniref:Uncharacterized protein n=1 Tax=Haemonchus placei TaxID=6290 RepID=A0A3P7U601_HAEPC|nr:unnamed protein product [Haemonchus placei]